MNYGSLVFERGPEEGIEVVRNEDGKILSTSEKKKIYRAIEVLLSDPIMSISNDFNSRLMRETLY